jgi:hypothetical protein
MASMARSGCSRQLVAYTPAVMAATAAMTPRSAVVALSLVIFASLSQAVCHRLIAASPSFVPPPWITPKSFKGSLQAKNGPAASLISSVRVGLEPTTPDFVVLGCRPISCMSSAVRPA